MPGFEKAKLATGEFRSEYIQRRLAEGADRKAIHAEINAPGFYTGPEGKSWPLSVVDAEKRKLERAAAPKPVGGDVKPEDGDGAASPDVPEEFQGVLSPEDMADIRAEAQKELDADKRKAARKEAFKKAKEELRIQARLAEERGTPKGDLVDVHIDLAPYAADIKLDGKTFEHGRTYRVNRKVANVLYEQMQRSYQHDASLHGASENAYRKPRNATINMRTGQTTGTAGLRV